MPYDLEPIQDDPVSESEQQERLKDMQREQAETLRDALGPELFDWLESFDDVDFLVGD